MIDKDFSKFTLICDICGEPVDEQFDRFMEAVEYKKGNGWKSKKTKDEWQDVCPECQKA